MSKLSGESRMVKTWEHALEEYRYPVNLADYEFAAAESSEWFELNLKTGDRAETINFEDRFRNMAQNHIEAWYEIVFWKNYSYGLSRQSVISSVMHRVYLSNAESLLRTIKHRGNTDKSLEEMIEEIDLDAEFLAEFGYDRSDADEESKITAERLWERCLRYIDEPGLESFQAFRDTLFKGNGIATAMTFPAFLKPDIFPMVDVHVARWSSANGTDHDYSRFGGPSLVTHSNLGKRPLTDREWPFVQSWIEWCRFTAKRLSDLTAFQWRARDVDMVVFTAQKKKLPLEPLYR